MKPDLSLQTNHLLGLSDDELKWAIVNCFSRDPTLLTLTLSGFQPNLSPEALGQERVEFVSPGTLSQIRSACAYFLRYVEALPEIPTNWQRRATSYLHKHAAEALVGGYISNGALILSAALCGVVFEQIPGTQNAWLGLSEPPTRLLPAFASARHDGDPPPRLGRGDDTRRLGATR